MKRFLSIFLAFFALSLAACTNSDEENSINLSVNITNLIFSSEAGSETISINAPDEWTAQVDNNLVNDWCTISPSNGFARDKFIYINVTENTSSYERSASLIIKSKSQQQVVEITQKQKDAIVIAKDSYTVDYAGGEIDIEVGHNVDFDIEISHDWITTTSTRAFETETLTFNIAANNSNDGRQGTIKFTSKDKAITQTVKVFQSQSNALIVSKKDIVIDEKAQNVEFEVRANVEYTVSSPSASWLHREDTRAMTSQTITFDVDANSGYNSREAKIIVQSKDGSLKETITITQAQKDAIVLATNSYTVDYAGGEIDIEVGHNIDFDIEISHDWITTAATRAFETETLTFVVAANPTEDARQGTIKFISKDKSITQTVKVVQNGKPANNEIWYTTTDGKLLDPYKPEAFGANIVSNTYENGKGIITFDGNVTEIGNLAFGNCSSLTNITIPDSVTTIGELAFYQCNSLTSVTIGNSVTTIGEYAFSYCRSLTSVTIGNSVTTIGEYAFYQCNSLTSVTIPDSVRMIEASAFSGCLSLKSVYCKPETPPTAEYHYSWWDAFNNNASGRKIYVPKNSVAAYKAAYGWKDYADAIVGYDF